MADVRAVPCFTITEHVARLIRFWNDWTEVAPDPENPPANGQSVLGHWSFNVGISSQSQTALVEIDSTATTTC